MTVKMTKRGPPVEKAELETLAKALENAIPEAFARFLEANNGATPAANEFDVGPDNGSGINEFFSVKEILSEKRKMSQRISPESWPIADAEGGNLVCLRRAGSGVWDVVFWDHELESEYTLSDSFDAFLAALRPFDPSSVVLRPGQVKEAWIDPSLLEDD